MASKTRVIDGRVFEQKPDGKWGPTYHQSLIDADNAAAAERRRELANRPKPAVHSPVNTVQSDSSVMLAAGLALGIALF